MKHSFLFLCVLSSALFPRAASAINDRFVDEYEDAPEFYQPVPADEITPYTENEPVADPTEPDPYPTLKAATLAKLKSKGNWSYEFVLIRRSGVADLIGQYRVNEPMKPASTLKLFTGWMGFSEKAQTDDFLSGMLHRSDNFQADQTLKKTGGIKKMLQFYKELALPITSTNFKPVDGSGLSHSNRVTVALEIDLLKHIRQTAQYDAFKTMLAQPGEIGTLRKRLPDLDDRLYGKTGTLRDTAALAGFIEIDQGTLIFSMISNQLKIPVASARKIIDEVVQDHVTFAQTLPIDFIFQNGNSIGPWPQDSTLIMMPLSSVPAALE
jgi:D-alanyl-D-alanine carboxypeptidase